ncbi:MAG: hypothetical protein L0027_03580 [Candidatus Rokubacteria bacterium]|nr:hypothetical protein [Candidatus Rokubacteria bacterium]
MRAVIEKLLLLFVVTAVVLNFPILAVVNRPATVAGVPILYVYLFGVWAVVIGAVYLLARRPWDDER